jgi:hypothetical protein
VHGSRGEGQVAPSWLEGRQEGLEVVRKDGKERKQAALASRARTLDTRRHATNSTPSYTARERAERETELEHL